MSGKYTVSLRAPFASNWSKVQYESLASALSGAWRKRNKDCSVDNITYERQVVINSEDLAQAFAEMDNLVREQPKCQPYELAEQIIREREKAEATQET